MIDRGRDIAEKGSSLGSRLRNEGEKRIIVLIIAA